MLMYRGVCKGLRGFFVLCFVLYGVLALSACAEDNHQVVCPSLVEWPKDFQTKLAGEMLLHSEQEMPAFHELALRAEQQRLAVKACSDGPKR